MSRVPDATAQQRSGRANVYLALAVLGFLAPLAFGIAFIADHGLDGGEMLDQLFANTVSTLVIIDLTISAIAFWVWLSQEAPRIGIRRWWPFVVATVAVGLCFALPLFLYLRETRRPAGPAPA